MRVLVLGASGLLGPYLSDAAEELGQVVRCGHRGGEIACDATKPSEIAALISYLVPDIIFNCIALTDVDECERNKPLAKRLNHQVVATLVDTVSADTTIVQFSTDQVYSGCNAPHDELATNPINEYGRSKLAGEKEALRHPSGLVLRTNFFGPSRTPSRKSLSDWMIKNLSRGTPITLFEDSLFSPLHVDSVAHYATHAVASGLQGVYNLGCREGASKAEFGYDLARHLCLDPANARRGNSTDIPGRARRPKDMRMDVTRIESSLGSTMPTMHDEIRRLKL